MPNINLSLNERAWKMLNELSEKTGRTKADILRNALMLMYLTEKESKNNRSLAFIDDESDEPVAKIVNIF